MLPAMELSSLWTSPSTLRATAVTAAVTRSCEHFDVVFIDDLRVDCDSADRLHAAHLDRHRPASGRSSSTRSSSTCFLNVSAEAPEAGFMMTVHFQD